MELVIQYEFIEVRLRYSNIRLNKQKSMVFHLMNVFSPSDKVLAAETCGVLVVLSIFNCVVYKIMDALDCMSSKPLNNTIIMFPEEIRFSVVGHPLHYETIFVFMISTLNLFII